MAFQELNADARSRVVNLMRLDDEFKLFSKACTWPDHPRIRGSEHYVNLPRSASQFEDEACPTANSCVVSAILNDTRDLALFEDDKERLRLLKSLGHWVGDLHQPMHVSFADDKGANKIDVDGPCNSNLHSVWDTCIIQEEIGRDPREIAIELRAEISDEDRAQWLAGELSLETVLGWADESLAITTDPDTGYCVMADGVCRYSETEETFSGTEKKVDANSAYLKLHAPIVRERMKMAAVRLAGILNTALGDDTDSGLLNKRTTFASAELENKESPRNSDLRQELHLKAKANHRPISYKEAYQVLAEVHSDPENSGNIMLFYTGRSQPKDLRVGKDSKDGWNREHLWPQSHGAGSLPMRSDLHHLMPTDATVNSNRGSLDFDEGGSPEGEAPDTFKDGDSFEPRDEVKGDVARAIFYMDIRYEGSNGEPNLRVVKGSNSGKNEVGDVCTLLAWHKADPVSDFERQRNDEVQEIQGNRNVFVDSPELVTTLFEANCL